MLIEILDLGLDQIFHKLRESWIWVTRTPGSPRLDGYYLSVLLDEILASSGAGLEFVPKQSGPLKDQVRAGLAIS